MTGSTRSLISVAVAVLVAGMALYAGLEAQTFHKSSIWFPTFAAIVCGVCASLVAIRELVELAGRRRALAALHEPEEDDGDTSVSALLQWTAWFVGLFALFVLLGGFVGTAIWIFAFLRKAGGQSLRFALAGGAATVLALFMLHKYLQFAVPVGLLGF